MAGPYAHRPVLVSESLAHLDPGPDQVFVDGTVGGGGHAAAILERTGPDGLLIGLDRDPDAIEAASERLAAFGPRVRLVRASFRALLSVLGELGVPRVDGVLLDLGVSSAQLDRPERGFAFAPAHAADTPLDMRMGPDGETTAAELLAQLDEAELARCLRDYGELRGARRLARALVHARERAPLRTASDLVSVVEATGVGRGRRHHPATLVFQALRIAVNDELGALDEGLDAAIASLRGGRRLVVIAYHSLEDRIVKRRLRQAQRGCICPPAQPVCTCGIAPSLRVLTRRPISPTEREVEQNPRARSARLRAAERVGEAA